MKLRGLPILLISLCSFLPSGAALAADVAPPNILLLLADDLGYGDIGVNGCSDFATPNIDSIARNGVLFTSGYVSAPVCSPSRAGLLTGRCQTRFGHEFNHFQADVSPFGLPRTEKTAAQWLKDAGYDTGHIGKWHLGGMRKPEFRAEVRGFDESVWFQGQGKLPPLVFFRHGGEAGREELRQGTEVERVATFFFDRKDPKFQEAEKANAPYVDIAMAQEASSFIVRHSSRPWFLYVAFLTPHTPLQTPPGSEEAFSPVTNENRRKCAAMMTFLDRSVGEVLHTLRNTGQEERTLIVFLSDNGAIGDNGSKNTPLKNQKGTLWEGAIRVPFLMQWKAGIPAGQVVDAPVSSLDLLPTALAAAGATAPDSAGFDGSNLLPFLTGKTSAFPHDALFWRYGRQMAVRSGHWKLERSANSDPNIPGADPSQAEIPPLRLYNLAEDIGEKNDLAAAEPGKVSELQAKWDEWNAGNIEALWDYNSPEHPEKTKSGISPTPLREVERLNPALPSK